jgi:phosphatidylserine decarboxylase
MRLTVLAQYVLPQKLLTRVIYAATRWRFRPWKNLLIGLLSRIYRIARDEALSPHAADYPHFNAFFTRALKPGARPLDTHPRAALMPADGRISQFGTVRAGRIVQAKGRDYSVAELLADDTAATRYADARFITVYLSPRDYHRVHMPLAGRLRETVHVPGQLFSVAPGTVEDVPRLFARNERLVCHFDTDHGPLAMVMVGAMLVSGVETVWSGVVIPPYARAVTRVGHEQADIRLERGAEMARFNMGSTVVVLLPPGFEFVPECAPQVAVRMGQRLALRD